MIDPPAGQAPVVVVGTRVTNEAEITAPIMGQPTLVRQGSRRAQEALQTQPKTTFCQGNVLNIVLTALYWAAYFSGGGADAPCSSDVPTWLFIGGIQSLVGLAMSLLVACLLSQAFLDILMHIQGNTQAEREPFDGLGTVIVPHAPSMGLAAIMSLCYMLFGLVWLVYGMIQVSHTESFSYRTQMAINQGFAMGEPVVLPDGFIGCSRNMMDLGRVIIGIHLAAFGFMICCGVCCGSCIAAAIKSGAEGARQRLAEDDDSSV